MIFGKTTEQKIADVKQRAEYLKNWHPCYFLWPVKLENGQYAWLRWGERRVETDVSWCGTIFICRRTSYRASQEKPSRRTGYWGPLPGIGWFAAAFFLGALLF